MLQARDLPADDIASALQSLLLPAPAASAAAAVPSATRHAQQLRTRAEQAVNAAEACEPGPERHCLIASASVATAVLEGFSDQVGMFSYCKLDRKLSTAAMKAQGVRAKLKSSN